MAQLLLLVAYSVLFLVLVLSRENKLNVIFIIFLFFFYHTLIVFSQVYLNHLGVYFHPSDPTFYYEAALNNAKSIIHGVDDLNHIYYIFLNKVFLSSFDTVDAAAIALKSFNSTILLVAYGIATSKPN